MNLRYHYKETVDTGVVPRKGEIDKAYKQKGRHLWMSAFKLKNQKRLLDGV